MHREGSPEFEATYFALRVGLIFCAVLVLTAPLVHWAVSGVLVPTISDSWYTPGRSIFVVGLSAVAVLLVVVRGDTLTEQTLLNLAGLLAFLTAANATQPIDEQGMMRPFDEAVLTGNAYATGALIGVGVAMLVAARRLPIELSGGPWQVATVTRRVLQGVLPGLIVVLAVVYLIARPWLVQHLHLIAAVSMFAVLSIVAFLRTRWGLRLLMAIGDHARDGSLCTMRDGGAMGDRAGEASSGSMGSSASDGVYLALSVAMLATVSAAGALLLIGNSLSILLWVEIVLVVLFILFWSFQTWQAWRATRSTPITT